MQNDNIAPFGYKIDDTSPKVYPFGCKENGISTEVHFSDMKNSKVTPKVYIAAPFGTKDSEKRKNVIRTKEILENHGFQVLAPWEYVIPNAWDYPNHEWGRMVSEHDIADIQASDLVVVLSYGREQTTSGTNWEAGFAFGIGKRILLVEMTNNVMSLMLANNRYATIQGLDGLEKYDFSTMPESRDNETEQK